MWDGTLAVHWEAWATFVFMIANCDKEGYIDMTPDSISARSRLPIEIVTKGLAVLEAPDPLSRSQDHEGRRLERIDAHRPWGWRIVNYLHYRTLADQDTRRAQNREAQQRSRERRKQQSAAVSTHKQRSAPVSTCQHRSAQAEAEAYAKEKDLEPFRAADAAQAPAVGSWSGRFDQFWTAYPRKRSKLAAWRVWERLKVDADRNDLFDKIMAGLDTAKISSEWRDESGKFIPYPSKWLRDGCWQDEHSKGNGRDLRAEGDEEYRRNNPSIFEEAEA
jgi:hypothetical protein